MVNAKTKHFFTASALAFSLCVSAQEQTAQEQPMNENKTTLESIRYIDLPATRFIGKEVKVDHLPPEERGDKYGEMNRRRGEFMPTLDALLPEHGVEVANACALMHFNNRACDEPGNTMHYIVGKFFKAGTPVPDGFDHWDMPETTIAFSVLHGEIKNIFAPGNPANALHLTIQKFMADGYEIMYPANYLEVEVHLGDTIPEDGVATNVGYILAVRKKPVEPASNL